MSVRHRPGVEMKLYIGVGGSDNNAVALREMKSNEEPSLGARWVEIEFLHDTVFLCYDRFSEASHAMGHVPWPLCFDLLCNSLTHIPAVATSKRSIAV